MNQFLVKKTDWNGISFLGKLRHFYATTEVFCISKPFCRRGGFLFSSGMMISLCQYFLKYFTPEIAISPDRNTRLWHFSKVKALQRTRAMIICDFLLVVEQYVTFYQKYWVIEYFFVLPFRPPLSWLLILGLLDEDEAEIETDIIIGSCCVVWLLAAIMVPLIVVHGPSHFPRFDKVPCFLLDKNFLLKFLQSL